jgi:hypothetical protein
VSHTPEGHTLAGARDAGMELPQVAANVSGPIDLSAAAALLYDRGFFKPGNGADTELTVLQYDRDKELSRDGLLELAERLSQRGFALRHVPNPDRPGEYMVAVSGLGGVEIYPSGAPASWDSKEPRSSQANVKLRGSDANSPTKAETFAPKYNDLVLLKETCRFEGTLAAAVILSFRGGQIPIGDPRDGKHNGEKRLANGDALSR